MKTEVKVAVFSLIAAVLGSMAGGFGSFMAAKQAAEASVEAVMRKAGSEWDLTRTASVLQSAREDFASDNSASYAAWVCYHSILWDCANQEWSVTNPSDKRLSRLCPPKLPIAYETECPVRKNAN